MPELAYRPYRIKNLKNPEHAAAYLTAILARDNGDFERGLLQAALADVREAVTGETPESSANSLLTGTEEPAIDRLLQILDALGFQLTVIPKSEDFDSRSKSQIPLNPKS
ncbi:MAG: transcriptional regulator [Cyanobacteria bacterium SID2]|nr:transcriptional regulator [Cyanobacteria bacterium SID2]